MLLLGLNFDSISSSADEYFPFGDRPCKRRGERLQIWYFRHNRSLMMMLVIRIRTTTTTQRRGVVNIRVPPDGQLLVRCWEVVLDKLHGFISHSLALTVHNVAVGDTTSRQVVGSIGLVCSAACPTEHHE